MEKEEIKFEVTEEGRAKRLDKFLADRFHDRFSRVFIQRLITKNSVLLNGEEVKNHYLVRQGDRVEIKIPEPVLSSITPEKIKLHIIYEDDDLLVVNKPRGMVVHPAPGNYSGTLVNALLAHCRDLSGIGGVTKPGIVHRIDKDASGLLVVAKNDHAHKSLSRQFKAKAAKRLYVAVVKGVMDLDNGIIELPIGRSSRDRKKMAVSYEKSKDAVTRYSVMDRMADSTLLEIVLGTGRTHQIRVHMSHIGHPLLGDVKYGSPNAEAKVLCLHAKTLGFTHPVTGKYMEFTSDIPKDMKAIIKERRNASKRTASGK